MVNGWISMDWMGKYAECETKNNTNLCRWRADVLSWGIGIVIVWFLFNVVQRVEKKLGTKSHGTKEILFNYVTIVNEPNVMGFNYSADKFSSSLFFCVYKTDSKKFLLLQDFFQEERKLFLEKNIHEICTAEYRVPL